MAALLPLLVGGMSIVLTFLGLRLASEVGDVSVFALNLVTGLGLGLAIDYSLFIVSRYREEIARSGPGRRRCGARSPPRAARCCSARSPWPPRWPSLLVFPQRFLYSMGLGGMMVSLIAARGGADRAAGRAGAARARG